jgi:hypothetical protein
MEFRLHSHRFAETILRTRFPAAFRHLQRAIRGIGERDLIDAFESFEKAPVGLQRALNKAIGDALRGGWTAESQIFAGEAFSSNAWRLDFAREGVAVEVAFNNRGSAAWNLVKLTLSAELNHLHKDTTTSVGVLITATDALKAVGNIDSAVGTFDQFRKYADAMANILTSPILLVGLEAPVGFRVERVRGTKSGAIVRVAQ